VAADRLLAKRERDFLSGLIRASARNLATRNGEEALLTRQRIYPVFMTLGTRLLTNALDG
jgi:hypothetical protein